MAHFFKPNAERRIESATYGLLLVWAGVVLIVDFDKHKKGIPALVAGSILLVSAIAQKAMGFEAGLLFWGGGLAFAISGLSDLTGGTHRRVSWWAIILIVAGVWVLVRSLVWSGRSRRKPPRIYGVKHPEDHL